MRVYDPLTGLRSRETASVGVMCWAPLRPIPPKTSLAVASEVALVWSINPSWTYSQVKSKILSTVRTTPSLTGKCVTGGVLNVNNAVH